MKNRLALWIIPVWLGLGGISNRANAQEKAPAPAAAPANAPAKAPAAVEGVKGVKQDAVERVKNVESGVTAGTKNAAQGVNKVNGVETVNGVKQDAVERVKNVESGVTAGTKNAAQGVNKIDGVETINGVKAEGRPAVAPVQPVVQPVIAGAGSIQAVNGVGGINAAKLRNLEAALQLKHGDAGPPTGKGRAAAAGLLGPPGGKLGPKAKDGREGFQEFEKLQNSGS